MTDPFLSQLAQRLVSEYGEDRNSPWVWGLLEADLATKQGRDFLLLLSGYLVGTHGLSIYSPLIKQLGRLVDGEGRPRKLRISRRRIGKFGQQVRTLGSEGK